MATNPESAGNRNIMAASAYGQPAYELKQRSPRSGSIVNSQAHDENSMPPSKIQQILSELFRLSLCRNDDYNLAHSTMLKNSRTFANQKAFANNQSNINNRNKILNDLKAREEERDHRENQISKEMSLLSKSSFFQVEKHLRKMIRKMLLLTVDRTS